MRTLARSLTGLALAAALTAVPAAAAEAFGSATEIRPLLLGTEVPSVEVLDLEGAPVDLKSAIGTEDAVVIFYRGGW